MDYYAWNSAVTERTLAKEEPMIKIDTRRSILTSILLLALTYAAPAQRQPPLFAKSSLVAWCIVPYDKSERTPMQRASMLRELGISQFAYDWRDKHLPQFKKEIEALRENNIRLKAVWFWINGTSTGLLDQTNEFILQTLEKNNVKAELWLSFNDRFFEGLSDGEKLNKAVTAISEINDRAQAIGCTLQLYNHGSWFGEPVNQVRIIEAIGSRNIGIVYNFHHARHQVQEFPKLIKLMLPYLSTVNINGMKEGGPMILPVGAGDYELRMLQDLKTSGYKGSIGILGHVEDEDAKVVLQRNIDGLKSLLARMGDKEALRTY